MMRFLPLVWAGVWRKPTRALLTTLGVMAAFTMLGLLGSIDAGFQHARDVSLLDRLFTDSRFGKPMPVAYRDQIARVPGVTVVGIRTGLFGYYQERKNTIFFNGGDEHYLDVRPEIHASPQLRKTLYETPNGVLMGSGHAKKFGWKVGDTIPITSPLERADGAKVWNMEILAIVDTDYETPGTSNYVVSNYAYIDEARATNKGTVERYLLRIANPDDAARIGKEIDALFANSPVPTRTMSERASTENNLQGLGDLGAFINMVVAAVLFMLLFLTGNSMMQSAEERTAEFAVMKTLGFGDAGIAAVLLSEALVQCLPAALIGLWIGTNLTKFMPQNFPRPTTTPWSAIALGLVAALLVAAISSAMPSWRHGRRPVVDALRAG